MDGERIYRLDTHPIQPYRLAEYAILILRPRVHLAGHIHHAAQGDTAPVVAHRYHARLGIQRHVNPPAVAHHMLVERIVKHLLEQHVDPVVWLGTIAQFAYVHPGPATDVLPPLQGLDGIFSVNWGIGHRNIDAKKDNWKMDFHAEGQALAPYLIPPPPAPAARPPAGACTRVS